MGAAPHTTKMGIGGGPQWLSACGTPAGDTDAAPAVAPFNPGLLRGSCLEPCLHWPKRPPWCMDRRRGTEVTKSLY